jgi:LuxR family transcriptional regulator, maltose regulon positive regulatory protein
LHRADLPAVRQHLVTAQRLRPELTYALPHLALQARIELTRVYIALADLAAARTLMREIDELLRRRPGMEPWKTKPRNCRPSCRRSAGQTSREHRR